jgi:hypothetical protein
MHLSSLARNWAVLVLTTLAVPDLHIALASRRSARHTALILQERVQRLHTTLTAYPNVKRIIGVHKILT